MHSLQIGVMGGAGFIGRRLVSQLLAAGHRVRVGDIVEWKHPDVEFVRCDVCDPKMTGQFVRELDVVYNLAAEHRDDVRPVERYELVNVAGARTLCGALSDAGVKRLVFTSSVAVYGNFEGVADENTPMRPFNEYGRTKREAEAVYRAWANADGDRSLMIVRPTVVFGEGNRGNVFNLANQIARGRFLMVGAGDNRKSMAYVENVAAFLRFLAAASPGTQTYNYSDAPDMDMNALVATIRAHLGFSTQARARLPLSLGVYAGTVCDWIAHLSGRSLPISAVRIKKFCANTRVSAARALATGFRPSYSLEDGVRRFLHYEFGSTTELPTSTETA